MKVEKNSTERMLKRPGALSPGDVEHIKLDKIIATVLVGHRAPVSVAGLP